jgi:hypothetical protein
MRSWLWLGAVFTAIAVVIFGLGMQIGAQSNFGGGWWGPGMMGGYGYRMGPWMMGPGAFGGYGSGPGPWMAGPSWRGTHGPLNLTASDAKDFFQRWLASEGNPRLKLGNVTEKDTDTITAEIVTADKDVLVQRFIMNRHTGFSYPSGD